nr:MAG TPA: hypothetical protein [Caudoviricetes sp.]
MTDGEIAAMWRTCKNRNEQVNILADLNVKSRVEMLDKLRELGCDLRGVKTTKVKKAGGAPPKPPMDELRAMELHSEGLDDLAISEALGESVTRVKNWRRRMKLKPNGTPKFETAPAEEPERKEETMEPVKKTETSPRVGMSAGALREILEGLCRGYDGGKAVIRCDGQEVREALVRVLYAGDGSVDSVELELGV